MSFFTYTLLPYWTRFFSLFLLVIASLGVIADKLTEFSFSLQLSLWLALLALYLLAFSKEAVEDERVMQLRRMCGFTAMGIGISMHIAVSFVRFIGNSTFTPDANQILIFPLFTIAVYHLYFRLALKFDDHHTSAEESLAARMDRSPSLYLVYGTFLLFIIVILFLRWKTMLS